MSQKLGTLEYAMQTSQPIGLSHRIMGPLSHSRIPVAAALHTDFSLCGRVEIHADICRSETCRPSCLSVSGFRLLLDWPVLHCRCSRDAVGSCGVAGV